MKTIYELGLEYIKEDLNLSKEAYDFFGYNDDKPKQKKRRKSRRGLENEYKKALKKYHDEKQKTEDIKKEIEDLAKKANKLSEKYDSSYKRMKEIYDKMESIRQKINKLDDEGAKYLEPEEEPEELDVEEGNVSVESSDNE